MKRGERGFTLVELVVSLAVAGVVFGGIGMGFYHLVTVPDYGNQKLTALHELENAGHWFTRDGQMAESAIPTGGKVILGYPHESTVIYRLLGSNLVRDAAEDSITLARNIEKVIFTVDGRVVTMQITAAPAGRWDVSENETYQVCLRVSDA